MARQSAVSLLIARRVLGVPPVVLAALLLAAGPSGAALAASLKAGQVALAYGIATAQNGGEGPRIVGAGSELFTGDVVTTGARSVAVLTLDDGTRITLRPDTAFKVEAFNIEEHHEQALYRLFKGGLRAVTGFISKRNPNAARLSTTVATIGIRGTEFDARLCGPECAEEARNRPVPAGHAGFVKGQVIARAPGGQRTRLVAAGAPVYTGDSLVTGMESYAVVAFLDKSRVTLLPNTEFRVDQMQYDDARPDEGRGFFNLLRGGLRAVSGLIGHRDPRAYRMQTPVATIGIRGTGYDLFVQGTGATPGGATAPGQDGVYASVWEGEIDFGGGHPLAAGQTALVGAPNTLPLPVPAMPITITQPKPNDVPISVPPPAPSSAAPGQGLYVSCYAGNCAMETPGKTIDLKPGQAGYVGGGGAAEQLKEIPPFMAEDHVYHGIETNQGVNPLGGFPGGGAECSIR